MAVLRAGHQIAAEDVAPGVDLQIPLAEGAHLGGHVAAALYRYTPPGHGGDPLGETVGADGGVEGHDVPICLVVLRRPPLEAEIETVVLRTVGGLRCRVPGARGLPGAGDAPPRLQVDVAAVTVVPGLQPGVQELNFLAVNDDCGELHRSGRLAGGADRPVAGGAVVVQQNIPPHRQADVAGGGLDHPAVQDQVPSNPAAHRAAEAPQAVVHIVEQDAAAGVGPVQGCVAAGGEVDRSALAVDHDPGIHGQVPRLLSVDRHPVRRARSGAGHQVDVPGGENRGGTQGCVVGRGVVQQVLVDDQVAPGPQGQNARLAGGQVQILVGGQAAQADVAAAPHLHAGHEPECVVAPPPQEPAGNGLAVGRDEAVGGVEHGGQLQGRVAVQGVDPGRLGRDQRGALYGVVQIGIGEIQQ